MTYDDADELDSADFGEVLAREVIKVVPDSKLFELTRSKVGGEGPELDLGRLVQACRHVLPAAIGQAMKTLEWYNKACDAEVESVPADFIDDLADAVLERLEERRQEEEED